MDLYTINPKYLEYLYKYDNHVMIEHKGGNPRPYVGVLIKQTDYNYFIPLSSPKPKHNKMHNTIDFHKIKGGKLGVVELNNMIPVNLKLVNKIEIDKISINSSNDKKYKWLLTEQKNWFSTKYTEEIIIKKATTLYDLISSQKRNKFLQDRCCNFPLLEEKCREYEKMLENQKTKQAEEEITI